MSALTRMHSPSSPATRHGPSSQSLPLKEKPMAQFASISSGQRLKSHAGEQKLCRRMVQMTSVLFVPVVLLRRAFRLTAQKTSAGSRPSVFAEARADASAIIPYIFMG